MAITDDARTDLHQYLRETMGDERAGTLMAYLPPTGWADVATRRDLDILRIELRAELAELRAELRTGLADVRAEFNRSLRVTVLTMVATNITLFGLAIVTVHRA